MPGQPSSDAIDILLKYDAWATHALLDRCRSLGKEQFHRPFPIGLGSLHLNLTHIIGVMRRWADRLAGRPLRPALHAVAGRPDIAADAADRTVDELQALLEDAASDLSDIAAQCRSKGLETTISMQWPGPDGHMKIYTFTRGCVLVHVATHGAHHRAQCLNMLRQLEAPGSSSPLPEISAIEWQAAVELPPSAG